MQFVVDRSKPTPSFADGIEAKVEAALRVYGCELIQQIGILLKVYAVVVVLYLWSNRFFRFVSCDE
jgi:hypothetical protein